MNIVVIIVNESVNKVLVALSSCDHNNVHNKIKVHKGVYIESSMREERL